MCDNWFSKIIRDDNGKLKKNYKTPIAVESDCDYSQELKKWFKALRWEFEENDVESEYLNIIDQYAEWILEAINKQYSGNVSQAQNLIDKLLENLVAGDEGIAVTTIANSIAFNDIEDATDEIDTEVQFYRARTSNNFTKYERKDMLHIPFDKRHLIATERFSIPGMPCLYLGSTSYCCWMEIGNPADHQFNVSYVHVKEDNTILSLTMNSESFEAILDMECTEKQKYTSFKLWLLSVATSYKVSQTERKYKSEYIIPQLIMLSSMKRGLYGVAYYSKQLTDDRFAPHVAVNLAVFAKYEGEKRLSSICKDIELTDSMNYSMFKKLGYSLRYRDTYLNATNSMHPVCIGDVERQYPYNETEFYEFDKFLVAHLNEELEPVDLDDVNK